jgi:hypothetical protein
VTAMTTLAALAALTIVVAVRSALADVGHGLI